MDKKELKERLDEVVKQIKINSKDAHFADKLIENLLSLKGQLDVEPLELDCGKREKALKGETFELIETNKGILYHTFGGYTIFVTPQMRALYGGLKEILDFTDEDYASLSEEMREAYDLHSSAVTYCLNIPTLVFGDANFLYDMAGATLKYLNSVADEAAQLKEETIEDIKKNIDYQEATEALEHLNEAVANIKTD